MLKTLHPVAGAFALVLITTFWLSTVMAEVFAGPELVALVKAAIPWGFLLLVPLLALAGVSGFRLAGKMRGPLVAAKRRRMPIIAANGIVVLIPCALFLASKAEAGAFDASFYAVQAIELVFGAINIALMAMNMRDGLRMKGRRR
ncbi:hypothetical protein [Martelella mediterranea]|uniref:Transmembrane protein n=1 Tax=Martelella mediterranea DSM 17316 TaxID=1122214 RepID=A0A1U9Z106_9HYPH|nr:hypothetical protein [Martelella mediterranea]AQZ51282.1 hypothetical protein Mame_01940 [Martelella mediterranea DSM 17316]